jgi:TolA-binding protein
MKKTIIAFCLSFAVLTGCSAVEEVTNGLDYVPEATEYINDVQQFSEEITAIAENAITDEKARAELEKLLNDMNLDIKEFSGLTPPAVFEDVHDQVIEHNKTLQEGIDKYLGAVENGDLTSDLLEQSGLLEDIGVYTDLLNEIKKLGE